jgi:hypothetical protein
MDWVVAFWPLCLGLSLLGGIGLLAGRNGGRGWPWLLVVFVFTCVTGSPYVFVATLLTILLVLALRGNLVRYRAFAVSLGLLLAVTFAAAAVRHANRVANLQKLRDEYPLVSLANQLDRAIGTASVVERSRTALEAEAIQAGQRAFNEARWRWDERNPGVNHRHISLQRLHERTFDQFVATPDFGVTRGVRPQPEWVELPPVEPIRLQCDREDIAPDPPLAPLPRGQLQNLHWLSAGDFLQEGRIGYVQDRDHVAGFQPHAITAAPDFADERLQSWQLAQVELVSLLLHDAPCVYETENLPNLSELSGLNVPTRPLDDFEAGSLERLWAEEDVVIDEALPNRIRMLGSLRALDDCRKCHDVPSGTLLGAFSYRLMARTLESSVAVTSTSDDD